MELTVKNYKDIIKIKNIIRHNILIKSIILIKNNCYIQAIPEGKYPKICIKYDKKTFNKKTNIFNQSRYKITKNYLVKNKV